MLRAGGTHKFTLRPAPLHNAMDDTMRSLPIVLVVGAFLAPRTASTLTVRRDVNCVALSPAAPHDTGVQRTDVVAAGTFRPPAPLAQRAWAGVPDVPFERLPAFCRVQIRLAPTPDSDIGVEVWLPETDWNGKVVMVGNGGLGGQVNWPMLAAMLARGYAAASTDGGHHAPGIMAAFLGHPERVTDHAVRAVHEGIVAARQLVTRRYGRSPRYAYFNGSSTGGRQAIKSALAYPSDFDGIVAGAPFNDAVRISIAQSFKVPAILARGVATPMRPTSLELLHRKAMERCDATDGVTDSVIERPDHCTVNVDVLACSSVAVTTDCLTTGEVEMAKALYAPLRHARTGDVILDGYSPGSERSWKTTSERSPGQYQAVLYLQQREWPGTFDFDTDVERLFSLDAGRMDASSPDLAPFFRRGGKLLQVHGWSDATIPPLTSVRYHDRVIAHLRETTLSRSSYRLFMVPGMGHSRGGDGVTAFETMRTIESWVEQGRAPDRIDGARVVDGSTIRTRPLCAWPQSARWDGRGSTDSAASFTCAEMP